jgi:hypothetical protein
MWFRSQPADNNELCKPAWRPDRQSGCRILIRVGRPIFRVVGLDTRQIGRQESQGLSVLAARGVPASFLASSASAGTEPPERARPAPSSPRPVGPSPVGQAKPDVYLLAHRMRKVKGRDNPALRTPEASSRLRAGFTLTQSEVTPLCPATSFSVPDSKGLVRPSPWGSKGQPPGGKTGLLFRLTILQLVLIHTHHHEKLQPLMPMITAQRIPPPLYVSSLSH